MVLQGESQLISTPPAEFFPLEAIESRILKLAAVINAELHAQGHDLVWLIDETGLSPDTVISLLSGKKERIEAEDVYSCCKVLGLSVRELENQMMQITVKQ